MRPCCAEDTKAISPKFPKLRIFENPFGPQTSLSPLQFRLYCHPQCHYKMSLLFKSFYYHQNNIFRFLSLEFPLGGDRKKSVHWQENALWTFSFKNAWACSGTYHKSNPITIVKGNTQILSLWSIYGWKMIRYVRFVLKIFQQKQWGGE